MKFTDLKQNVRNNMYSWTKTLCPAKQCLTLDGKLKANLSYLCYGNMLNIKYTALRCSTKPKLFHWCTKMMHFDMHA